jgi:hypothetical protein
MVVGIASLLEVTDALLKAEQVLGRPIHINMYTPEEWAGFKVSDPFISKISADAKIQDIPPATTTRI